MAGVGVPRLGSTGVPNDVEQGEVMLDEAVFGGGLSVRAGALIGHRGPGVGALTVADLMAPDALRVLKRRGGGRHVLREIHDFLLERTGSGLGGWDEELDLPLTRTRRAEARLEEALGILEALMGILGVGERGMLVGACRALKASASSDLFPGWHCPACLAFNGEAKRERAVCRACDAPHVKLEAVAEVGTVTIGVGALRALMEERDALRGALVRVQGRSSEILLECRRLKEEVRDG